jgi:hypothetical protein
LLDDPQVTWLAKMSHTRLADEEKLKKEKVRAMKLSGSFPMSK